MAANNNNPAPGSRLRRGVAGAFLLLLTVGCTRSSYTELFHFEGEPWQADQSAVFRFEPLTPDEGDYTLSIALRHTEQFAYNRLMLEIKGVNPRRQFWVDTLSVALTDARGKWVGKHYADHYDLTTLYRTHIRYPYPGTYALSVRQLNDPTSLDGILAIGVEATGCQLATD